MTKDQFKARAQSYATIAKSKVRRGLENSTIEANRTKHIDEIKQFDPAAAEVERKFFDADNAFAAAEMELAEYYASRLEGK